MSSPPPSLTRICRSCAQAKPLSAFLQLTGAHGTNYGTLCSTCRSAGRTTLAIDPNEDSTRRGSVGGAGIRGEEKLYRETEQKKEKASLDRSYLEQEKEQLTINAKKADLLSDIQDFEEKHRDPRTPSIEKTTPHIKSTQTISTTDKTQRVLHAARASFAEQVRTGQGAQEKKLTETIRVVAEAERKNTSTDFNTLIEAIAPGKVEYQGEGIKHLMNWLGSSSNISKTIRGLPSKTATPPDNKSTGKIAETILEGPGHPSQRSK